MNTNNYNKILFLCAKTIIIFEQLKFLKNERPEKKKQINELSRKIARFVSTKGNITNKKDYLLYNRILKNFICLCVGELTAIMKQEDVENSSIAILKYRLKTIPITDLKHNIHQITNLALSKKDLRLNYKQISDFLTNFVCVMMME